jgi:hypothetical protein
MNTGFEIRTTLAASGWDPDIEGSDNVRVHNPGKISTHIS